MDPSEYMQQQGPPPPQHQPDQQVFDGLGPAGFMQIPVHDLNGNGSYPSGVSAQQDLSFDNRAQNVRWGELQQQPFQGQQPAYPGGDLTGSSMQPDHAAPYGSFENQQHQLPGPPQDHQHQPIPQQFEQQQPQFDQQQHFQHQQQAPPQQEQMQLPGPPAGPPPSKRNRWGTPTIVAAAPGTGSSMPAPSAPDMAGAGTEGGDGDADAAAAERRRKRKSRWEAEEQAIVIAAPLVLGGSIVARFPKEIILTGGLRVSQLSHKGVLGLGECIGDFCSMMIP